MTSFIVPGLMEEEEHAGVIHFHPFSIDPPGASLTFVAFLLLYLRSHVGNVTTGVTVWRDHSLHAPVYPFLFAVAMLEAGYSTTIAPVTGWHPFHGDAACLAPWLWGPDALLHPSMEGLTMSFLLSRPVLTHGSHSTAFHPEALGSVTKPLTTTHLKACPQPVCMWHVGQRLMTSALEGL